MVVRAVALAATGGKTPGLEMAPGNVGFHGVLGGVPRRCGLGRGYFSGLVSRRAATLQT